MSGVLFRVAMTAEATHEILRALKPEPGIYFRLFVDKVIVPLSKHLVSPTIDSEFKKTYAQYLLKEVMPSEVRFSVDSEPVDIKSVFL